MRAENRDLVAVVSLELPEALLIAETKVAIGIHQALVEAEPGRAAAAIGVKLAPVEIGIAGIEDPSRSGVDGNARVAKCVARKRDHQDFRWKAVERVHRVESEPLLASGYTVSLPVTNAVPLGRAVPALRDEATAHSLGGLALHVHHMHACMGEILEAARMIEIEVREDDVADVAWGISERFDLVQRSLAHPEADVQHAAEQKAQPWMRVLNVLGAIAGIHQNEPLIGLNQLCSAWDHSENTFAEPVEQRAADGAIGAAAKIMDAHGVPTEDGRETFLRLNLWGTHGSKCRWGSLLLLVV